MRPILMALLLSCSLGWAQSWTPSQNLMPGDFGSSWTTGNNARSLGALGDTVFLVWYNATDTNYNTGHQVYFKMFDGTVWLAGQKISPGTNWRRHSWYPACAVDGQGSLHVVWESNDFIPTSDGASIYDIAYRRFSQGTWSGVTNVTTNSSQGYSWRPAIACGQDNLVHLAWQDNRQGTFRIFYKSLAGGSTWSSDLCLSPQGIYAGFPSLAVIGSQPAVVWQDFRDGSSQIYFRKGSPSGWGQDSAISQSTYGAFAPCLAGDEAGNLHAAWEDLRDGNFEIYYRRFSAQTQSWENVIRLTDDPFFSRQPFLQCQSDGTVNLFWADDRSGSYDIYHRRSVNNAWQPETTLTSHDGYSSLGPSAAADHSGNLHLVWSDFYVWYQAPDVFYMLGAYPKVSSVETQSEAMREKEVLLLPARPNPVRDGTRISMMTAESGWARLGIYNIAGQLVKELYRGHLSGGTHEFRWDAKDGNGNRVSNGLYLTRAESGGAAATGKIMVVR